MTKHNVRNGDPNGQFSVIIIQFYHIPTSFMCMLWWKEFDCQYIALDISTDLNIVARGVLNHFVKPRLRWANVTKWHNLTKKRLRTG